MSEVELRVKTLSGDTLTSLQVDPSLTAIAVKAIIQPLLSPGQQVENLVSQVGIFDGQQTIEEIGLESPIELQASVVQLEAYFEVKHPEDLTSPTNVEIIGSGTQARGMHNGDHDGKLLWMPKYPVNGRTHEWSIKIHNASCDMQFGIVRDTDRRIPVLNFKDGEHVPQQTENDPSWGFIPWGYGRRNDFINKHREWPAEGKGAKDGDTITTIVDSDAGTIRFRVNDEDYGIMSTTGIKGATVYPAALICHDKALIELLNIGVDGQQLALGRLSETK